jgi:hypothetical protein
MQTRLTQSERQSIEGFDLMDQLFDAPSVSVDCPDLVEIFPEDLEIPSLYVHDPVAIFAMEFPEE